MKREKTPNLTVGQFSRTVSHENGLRRVEKQFKHLIEGDMEVVRNVYDGLYPVQDKLDEDYSSD